MHDEHVSCLLAAFRRQRARRGAPGARRDGSSDDSGNDSGGGDDADLEGARPACETRARSRGRRGGSYHPAHKFYCVNFGEFTVFFEAGDGGGMRDLEPCT